MKKSFLFTLVIASACLSACSSDEESIADNNAAVEIKLSSITNNSMSRASIESNDAGVFSAEGISVFALASRKQEDGSKVNWSSTDEYACILNNKLFNAIPNTEKTLTNLVPVGTSYYYPLSDIYTYRFYGAYPSVSAENLSTSATQYKAKYTIDGTQDIIWGQSDDAGYSNKYFKNNPTAAAPNIAFKHLLTRLTFTCEPSGDYAKRLKEDPSVALFVKDVVVNNVPTEGNLIIADNENPANEGKIEFDKETGKDLYLKDENDATFSPVALAMNSDGTSNKVSVGSSMMLPSTNQFPVTIVLENKYGEEYVTYSKVLSLNGTSTFVSGKTYNVNFRVNSVTDIEVNTTATLDPWEFGEEINVDLQENNDHESVDLGLSVEWATCNIGANNPEEYGDYFAWAETIQQSDNRYTWESYKWCNGTATTITKYCTSTSYGIVDNKTILAPTHDAATVNWGDEWRTPTKAEEDELINNCTWTWTTLNGIKGYSVKSKKNDNSIFLPAAGYVTTGALKAQNELGIYWASSLHETKSNCAYNAGFNETDIRYDYLTSRYIGQSVRAVRKKAAASIPVTSIKITGSKTEIGVAETLQLSATVAPTNATNKTLKWGTSDVSIAKVSSAGLVTGVKAGIVTITAAAQDGSGVCGTYTMTISNTSNGHAYVDLGLSVKWATMNVGASAPEGIGNKYAWGETKTKSSYSWDNYKWASLGTYGNHNYDLKKYNSDAEWGKTDSKSTLDSADDAATANWGGKWRMPSRTEQQELLDNCTWTSTTVNKVKGFTVKSKKNGNSIFLPSGDVTKNYWARTRHGLCDRAYCIDYLSTIQWGVTSRPNGLNVRAVCP